MQHPVVSREEWLAARLGLLKEEKELTRRNDELAKFGRNCLGFGSTRIINSRLMRGMPCLLTFPRAFATSRIPLHVRSGLHCRLSILLGYRGWFQWVLCIWPTMT